MTKLIKKYLRDGSAVIFLQELGHHRILVSELVVIQTYDGENEYEDEGQLKIVSEVFDKPPKTVLDEEVTALRQEILEATNRLININQKIQDLSLDYNKLIAKIGKRHDAFKHIEEFVDDKIQFFFIPSTYCPEIATKNDALKTDNRWDDHQLKLLTLYGRTEGELEWRISTYSDGSGGHTTVIPCITLEDVKKEAQDFIDNLDPNGSTSSKLIAMAKTYGLELPNGYEERDQANTIAQKQQYVDIAVANLLKVQKDLDDTKAKLEMKNG